MWSVLKTILVLPLMLIVIALIFIFLFGAPLCVIVESFDMLRTRSTAPKGSRPEVQYAYNVGGVEYVSTRYAPISLGTLPHSGHFAGVARRSYPHRRQWPAPRLSILE